MFPNRAHDCKFLPVISSPLKGPFSNITLKPPFYPQSRYLIQDRDQARHL